MPFVFKELRAVVVGSTCHQGGTSVTDPHWCGTCQRPEPISIRIASDDIADLLITNLSKSTRMSPEEGAAFVRENPSFAQLLTTAERIEYACELFQQYAREAMAGISEIVEEYAGSARGAASLKAVREVIVLDIETTVMMDLIERTKLFETKRSPGDFAKRILKPLVTTLRKQLDVRHGGPRRGSLPPADAPVWSDFVRRTQELQPLWSRAKKSEETPTISHLSAAHQTKLQRAFHLKNLKPLFLALLQAGAEHALWNASNKDLPYENLAKRYRSYRGGVKQRS
jgi:hypothetical protein